MIEEQYYIVVVECGHVGHRNSIEITRYFKDYDIVDAYLSGLYMPRSKKKSHSVKIVRQISYEDYIAGKELEKENLYLNTFAS